MSTFNRTPQRPTSSPDDYSKKDLAFLQKIYKRYIRMGFTSREARFKALHYHSMKL